MAGSVRRRQSLSAAIIVAVALLGCRQASAGSALQLASALVTVNGTSNVHPYEASTRVVTLTRLQLSPAFAGGDVAPLVSPGIVEAFAITIPAATLTSPREGLDKNLHKALKVDRHADITFVLARLEPGAAPNAFKAVGALTIAGVTRDVTLDLTIDAAAATLRVKGSLALVMTDYGITPPKAMLGMLKTDPKVTIAFDTTFTLKTT